VRRALPWLGVAGSALALVAAVVWSVVALGAESTAHDARDGAYRLLQARIAVADAQRKLGGTDLEDALAAARGANETARRVGAITRNIVALLTPTERTAAGAQRSAVRGVRSATVAHRQTTIAARVLGVISGYQSSASRQALETNVALRRILAALRKTNASFPPTPVVP
jgi:hypothetical protein